MWESLKFLSENEPATCGMQMIYMNHEITVPTE